MRQTRNKLLEMLTDPNHDMATMEKAVNDYFSLLLGLIQPFEENESENKLRRAIKYRWTNSLLGTVVKYLFMLSLSLLDTELQGINVFKN